MVNLVKKYLDINGYQFNGNDFKESYLSHPNYPSLYAVTDTLNLLQIENIAARIPKEQFIELPDYFLSMVDGEFALVHKKATNVEMETIKGSFLKLSFDDFLNKWNQLVIAVEPNLISKSKHNTTYINWYSYLLPCIALIALSLFFNSYGLREILFLSTSIFGLIISVFIVQEKFGIKNEVVSKLCSLNTSTSCDAVIKSENSIINKWLSFSDLPLLFFATSMMSIIIQPISSGFLVGFLSLLILPIIGYSIWMQKVKIKKWCVLCLVVSFIIVCQSLFFGFTTTSFSKTITSINSLVLLFVALIITSSWFLIKPMITQKLKVENEVNELKRFKRDYRLFKFLSKDIKEVDEFNKLEGIQIGNVNTEVQLTIIISPSCGHCHTAYQDALALVKNYSQRISLNVLFNINPENIDNPYKIVVESLLAINNVLPEKVEEALSDWHIKKMELAVWKQMWIVEDITTSVNSQIEEQYNWCLKNQFNYTPVKIVNNKLFPKEYELNELKYFLDNFLHKGIASHELVQA